METRIIIELKHHCDNQATLLQMKCINELWFSERYAKYILFKKAFMVNGEIVTYNITKSEAEKLIDAMKNGSGITFNGYQEVVRANECEEEEYKKYIIPKKTFNSVEKTITKKTTIELKHYCDNGAILLQMKCIKELLLSYDNGDKIFKRAFIVNGEIVTNNITKSEAEKLIDALKSGDRIKFNGYDEVVSDNKWYGEYYKKHEKRKPTYLPIVPKATFESVKKMTIEDMENLYERYENEHD